MRRFIRRHRYFILFVILVILAHLSGGNNAY